MIPETIFTKMNDLGLTSEQSIGVSQLLFQSVEAMTDKTQTAIDKMMDRMEATISKMNASFGQQILAAVKETEEKIFARLAEEAQEAEEKKRLRREAIAARKSAKAALAPVQKEGEVAITPAMFQEDEAHRSNAVHDQARESDDTLMLTDTLMIEAKKKIFKERIDKAEAKARSYYASCPEEIPCLEVYILNLQTNAVREFSKGDPVLEPLHEALVDKRKALVEARETEEAGIATQPTYKEGDIYKDGSVITFVGTGDYVHTERDDAIRDHANKVQVEIFFEEQNFLISHQWETGYSDDEITDMAYAESCKLAFEAEKRFSLEFDKEHNIENNGEPRPPNHGWNYPPIVDVEAVTAT